MLIWGEIKNLKAYFAAERKMYLVCNKTDNNERDGK